MTRCAYLKAEQLRFSGLQYVFTRVPLSSSLLGGKRLRTASTLSRKYKNHAHARTVTTFKPGSSH